MMSVQSCVCLALYPTTYIIMRTFFAKCSGVAIFLKPTNITLQESESSAIIKVHKEGLSDLTMSVLLSTKDLSASGKRQDCVINIIIGATFLSTLLIQY